MAAQNGYTNVVSLLLSKSTAMLHARDKRGRTSLMLASANGHLDMVTLLIGQGADINAVDKVFIRITFNHEFPNSNACFGTHLTRTKDA